MPAGDGARVRSISLRTGKIHHWAFHVVICFVLGDRTVEMKTSIINGDVPLLMSKKALADLGMFFDVAANCADFTRVNLRKFELLTTSSGHPAIPIVPARPTVGTRRLVLDDSGPKSSEQYMAYAVSSFPRENHQHTKQGVQDPSTRATSTTTSSFTTTSKATFDTKAPHYRIFYDKNSARNSMSFLLKIVCNRHLLLDGGRVLASTRTFGWKASMHGIGYM